MQTQGELIGLFRIRRHPYHFGSTPLPLPDISRPAPGFRNAVWGWSRRFNQHHLVNIARPGPEDGLNEVKRIAVASDAYPNAGYTLLSALYRVVEHQGCFKTNQ